jgi:hypothetical protein
MNKDGDCFEAAGNLVIELPDEAILVHGTVSGQGPLKGMRIKHAWCELGDVVFDYSNGKQIVMRKEQYYRIGKIRKSQIKKYSKKQATKNMLRTGNYGPW